MLKQFSYIGDVLLDASGEVEQEPIPLQHHECIPRGICPNLTLQYSLKQSFSLVG